MTALPGAGIYVAEWESKKLDLQAADLTASIQELQLLRPTRSVLARPHAGLNKWMHRCLLHDTGLGPACIGGMLPGSCNAGHAKDKMLLSQLSLRMHIKDMAVHSRRASRRATPRPAWPRPRPRRPSGC